MRNFLNNVVRSFSQCCPLILDGILPALGLKVTANISARARVALSEMHAHSDSYGGGRSHYKDVATRAHMEEATRSYLGAHGGRLEAAMHALGYQTHSYGLEPPRDKVVLP